jgi:hypothetical protein
MSKEKFTVDKYGHLKHTVTEHPNHRARLAEHLMGNLSLGLMTGRIITKSNAVAREGTVEEEQMYLMDIQDLVDRACDVADALVTAWEDRGWMLPVETTETKE